jgi:hypothetical protein
MEARKKVWAGTDDAMLREAAAKGWTLMQTALRLRRTRLAVHRRAWALGLTFAKERRLPRSERGVSG